jgi:hypothetical protein
MPKVYLDIRIGSIEMYETPDTFYQTPMTCEHAPKTC